MMLTLLARTGGARLIAGRNFMAKASGVGVGMNRLVRTAIAPVAVGEKAAVGMATGPFRRLLSTSGIPRWAADCEAEPISFPDQEASSTQSELGGRSLEIKDAEIIFDRVWSRLESEKGLEQLRFPHELILLGGAPGAGKGTLTPAILKQRGMETKPIVVSSLLCTPEMEEMKRRGELIGDTEVIEALFRELMKPMYREGGALIDGFPRSSVQALCIVLLHRRLIELHERFFDTNLRMHFHRPIFRIAVLFVDEKTSVERQMKRGREIIAHNKEVEETGTGTLLEVRPTDVQPELARERYRVFKEHSFDALYDLRQHFQYHFVDASGPVEEVRRKIEEELQYQSSIELSPSTYNLIRALPLASQLISNARQLLVRRLDSYSDPNQIDLFKEVLRVVDKFTPILKRQALSGRAIIRSTDSVFQHPMAIDMALDVLSERGFSVVLDIDRQAIPFRMEKESNRVENLQSKVYIFTIDFPKPSIRKP